MGKLIKTKIVATVGPASMAPAILGQLIRAGVDVFRINFSHGTEPQHQAMLEGIRAAAEKLRRPVAVMADLCGPKIRVGEMTGGGVLLVGGSTLVIQRKPVVGTPERISTTLAEHNRAVARYLERLRMRSLTEAWDRFGLGIRLVVLKTDYRNLYEPLEDYIREVLADGVYDCVTLVLPEFVVHRWWEQILHNQTALRLHVAFHNTPGVVIANFRYYL